MAKMGNYCFPKTLIFEKLSSDWRRIMVPLKRYALERTLMSVKTERTNKTSWSYKIYHGNSHRIIPYKRTKKGLLPRLLEPLLQPMWKKHTSLKLWGKNTPLSHLIAWKKWWKALLNFCSRYQVIIIITITSFSVSFQARENVTPF